LDRLQKGLQLKERELRVLNDDFKQWIGFSKEAAADPLKK
jgi:hypothetical protein